MLDENIHRQTYCLRCSDGSCEDLNSSQLHPGSEWVDSMENFIENEVDCTLLSQFANECTKESDNMM